MSPDFLLGNQRNRDQFLGDLVTRLASTLQRDMGLELSEEFIKMVGVKVGDAIHHDYQSTSGDEPISVEQLAEILVDLKRKIDGGFSVESMDEEKIVLVNDRCPFGKKVQGLPSLCQMTSSVFGRIASQRFGYARVEIKEAIARANKRCRVVIHLQEPPVRGMHKGIEFYEADQGA